MRVHYFQFVIFSRRSIAAMTVYVCVRADAFHFVNDARVDGCCGRRRRCQPLFVNSLTLVIECVHRAPVQTNRKQEDMAQYSQWK